MIFLGLPDGLPPTNVDRGYTSITLLRSLTATIRNNPITIGCAEIKSKMCVASSEPDSHTKITSGLSNLILFRKAKSSEYITRDTRESALCVRSIMRPSSSTKPSPTIMIRCWCRIRLQHGIFSISSFSFLGYRVVWFSLVEVSVTATTGPRGR